MKTIALRANHSNISQAKNLNFLVKTPVLSPQTMGFNLSADTKSLTRLGSRFLYFSLCFFLLYAGYEKLFHTFSFPWIAKSFLLTFFIYIMTSYMCTIAQILCLPTGKIPVDMHDSPFLAKNTQEFWSKRWNTWVKDWLSLIAGKMTKNKNQSWKVFASFMISGLFHEVMFQLPYTLYTGNFLIGPMMAYFFIQWLGFIFDYKISNVASTKVRRFFMWIFLLIPSPLFINQAFIYFIGL